MLRTKSFIKKISFFYSLAALELAPLVKKNVFFFSSWRLRIKSLRKLKLSGKIAQARAKAPLTRRSTLC